MPRQILKYSKLRLYHPAFTKNCKSALSEFSKPHLKQNSIKKSIFHRLAPYINMILKYQKIILREYFVHTK